ncbi:MAG: hypothetical protein R3C44_21105 [Chloroflexota bacterium]
MIPEPTGVMGRFPAGETGYIEQAVAYYRLSKLLAQERADELEQAMTGQP